MTKTESETWTKNERDEKNGKTILRNVLINPEKVAPEEMWRMGERGSRPGPVPNRGDLPQTG